MPTAAAITPVLRAVLPVLLAAAIGAGCGGGSSSQQVAAPVITTQPSAQSVTAGETASFTVVATGTGLAFQWQRGTTDIPGASAATYVTPATVLGDDGATFRVLVTNAGGTATSSGATLQVQAPVAPARVTPWIAGMAGGAVALKANGTVWAWGDGGAGQLGSGGTASSTSPVQVKDGAGTAALDRVVKVSAGPTHVLALRDDGSVWTWGTTYALGASASGTQTALRPVQVAGVGGIGQLLHVVDVAAGDGVDAVAFDDGTVATWGDNRRGALGIGSPSGGSFVPADAFFPTLVPGVTGVVQVSAGLQRVLGRNSSGSIQSWGANPNGELGRAGADTATPAGVAGISTAARVVAGPDLSLAVLADGTARIWGRTGYTGTAGRGTGAACAVAATPGPLVLPRPTGAASTFAAVATAAGTGLLLYDGLLRETGALLADVAAGQCSLGLEVEPAPTGLVGVARGWGAFTHLWGTDGRVHGLGQNGAGQLGLGHIAVAAGPHELVGFNLLGAAPTAQQVFFTDFDAAVPAEVTPGAGAQRVPVQGFAGLGSSGRQFGGSFLRSATANVVTVSLAGLPAHRAISLDFLFAAIDSLDGAGSFPAGDYFHITLDGATLFREAFANATLSEVQTYISPPGVELARHVDLGFSGPGSFYTDSAYDLGMDPQFQLIPHTASTAVFTFQIEGAGVQSLDDESWAMDDLRISVVP